MISKKQLKNLYVFISIVYNNIVVDKKGKFRLLSYIVDTNLIFYKSVNRESRIIAFTLFQLSKYYPVSKILQDFLRSGLIFFYSIELNIVAPNDIKYILCFTHNDKNKIFKDFNLIADKLCQLDKSIKFYQDDQLEREFLKILSLNNKNITIRDILGSLVLKNDSKLITLDFYLINYHKSPRPDEAIYELINYIGSLKRNGFFIFNFRFINSYFVSEVYYIDFINEKNMGISNLEYEVNSFFNLDLICKFRISLKRAFSPLWRYSLSKYQNSLKDISEVLNLEYYYNSKNIIIFNEEFINLLNANGINFHQLSQNLFFINQSILVIVLATKRFKYILDLLKKYQSKYILLIIILNDKVYDDLMNIKNINTIPNLKIINYEDFYEIDLTSLKVNEKLKDT